MSTDSTNLFKISYGSTLPSKKCITVSQMHSKIAQCMQSTNCHTCTPTGSSYSVQKFLQKVKESCVPHLMKIGPNCGHNLVCR